MVTTSTVKNSTVFKDVFCLREYISNVNYTRYILARHPRKNLKFPCLIASKRLSHARGTCFEEWVSLAHLNLVWPINNQNASLFRKIPIHINVTLHRTKCLRPEQGNAWAPRNSSCVHRVECDGQSRLLSARQCILTLISACCPLPQLALIIYPSVRLTTWRCFLNWIEKWTPKDALRSGITLYIFYFLQKNNTVLKFLVMWREDRRSIMSDHILVPYRRKSKSLTQKD